MKAVIRRMAADRRGMTLFMHSRRAARLGPGLVVGAGRQHRRRACATGCASPSPTTRRRSWRYHIERVDLGIKGGMQDHYAATFGGVNFIEFYDKAVIVNPLRVRPDRLDELEYNLLLCYTGATRLSANILERQIASFVQQKRGSRARPGRAEGDGHRR